MTGHVWHDIDLGDCSERELLLLAVQRINDLASHVEAQNGAIWVLEALLQEDGANGDSQADAG